MYFNMMGIFLWFIIPYSKLIPITLAKHLGNATAESRWFAISYIFLAFVIMPLTLLGLSLAGHAVFGAIMGPIFFLLLCYVIVRILRNKKPDILPDWLLEFYWLPKCLREQPECLK